MAGRAYNLKDWSKEQDAELVSLWHSELSIKAICKKLIRVRDDVVGRSVFLKLPRKKPGCKKSQLEPVAKLTWRPCMNCRRNFGSEGIHNRLCDPCKKEYV